MLAACWPLCTVQNGAKERQRGPATCDVKSSVSKPSKRVAVFQPEFREDLRYWVKSDRATALKLLDLIEAVLRDPFEGVGKPEPLRYVLSGCWSRRVTQEHRLIYRVTDERIDFLQARYHY